MGKIKDISGQKFGRLTVLYRLHNYHDKHNSHWLCVCECGNLAEVSLPNLRSGTTKSCGCLNVEKCKVTHTKHGKCNSRLNKIYSDIKRRCNNTNRKAYDDYGGRGIVVCNEWRNDFMSFYDWSMANGYDDTLTIDRIDNDKGYSPDNCRWVNMKQQNRNKRNNRYFVINGDKRCLSEWCEMYSINYGKVQARLKYGWTIEQALELEERN